ncbi:MAG: fatty acid desaturase [Acidobacteria bacterium]|nr:fatty acid desaturase [Acidobacteriota bacterium]MBV9478233.1 fatty acid desaturase [Acidobacteriota bacterium]
MAYYADHAQDLKRDLAREIPVDALRELHRKRPLLHAFIALANLGALVGAAFAAVHFTVWYLWLPFAFVIGFAVFNCTVLLHEVVHRAVLEVSSERGYRILGLLYAIPSGISSSQFTRWHLDHHAGLGSDDDDPKRHYLSPKINARWLKFLYFTPALFPIYFRAAAKETAAYEPELRRRIARERLGTIAFQLSVLAVVAWLGGGYVAWKLYLVPVFFIFPIAFALNRLGQHYDIDPSDPAKWSTLMKASWFWDPVFLFSNYHLEHHYFPGVPFYNLPRLQKLLGPFYEKRGMVARGYGELVWRYLILNRKPHTNWVESAPSSVSPAADRIPL